jgi:hypothetical protein
MIVIARNNGPFYEKFDGLKERRGIIENKEYNVISWAYNQNGEWFIETDDFINIKEPKFYIRIINEDGFEHDYWNDYFLSNEEIRDIKIENLLNECTNNI